MSDRERDFRSSAQVDHGSFGTQLHSFFFFLVSPSHDLIFGRFPFLIIAVAPLTVPVSLIKGSHPYL